MKRYVIYAVLLGIGLLRVAVWLLRYLVFVVLMFLRPVIGLLFGTASALCLVCLALGFVIARDHHQMLWAFFGAGIASTAILFCYDALVLVLAPGRFPLLLAR
jgi:hypothetical protein